MAAVRIRPLFHALTSGSLFRGYRLLEQIGVGGEGVVWSALDETDGQLYAIKFKDVTDLAEAEAGNIGDEQQLDGLIRLRHAHILPILEYGFESPMRFTVSPYLPGGTLTQKMRVAPLTVEEILRHGTEIASALDYLHSQGIIHRDIKSQNVLLDLRNHCYLADFGLARQISTSTIAFHTGHGTPPYASPEQIQSRVLTRKSDLYSFGILLYEMFTGQLPWNGKKQLSVEQLNSDQELPDPREFNPSLPFILLDILRRATAADPTQRPPSATEIMRAIQVVFNVPTLVLAVGTSTDGWKVSDRDAEGLLKRAFAQWNSTDETFNLGLTKFALVHSKRKQLTLAGYQRFMLSQALIYGYDDSQWWQAVRDPNERLSVSAKLLRRHNEGVTGRIVTHLVNDPTISAMGLPAEITAVLLETGINTDNVFLRREIFEGIQKLTPPRSSWRGASALDADQAKRLGVFALEDSEFGDAAAELIGYLRSAPAVKVLISHRNDERKISALLLVQRVAGSLPAFVPGDLRLRLSAETIIQRLIQEPVSLMGAYVFAFLGAALGLGLQVYLTYNLPDFLDTARMTTSLIQGLIVGTIFGLGIFLTRVIMERFAPSPALARVLTATALGTIVLNTALLIFHVLFLSTPIRGLLVTAACLLIALTFALAGLLRSRLLRMTLTTVSVFAAVVGTWWLHTHYAASLTDLTPFLRYDYAWPLTRVISTALAVALPIGILGNLANLTVAHEK